MPITDEHYISASIITHLSANRQQMKTTADRSAIFYAQIGATSPLPKQVTLHVPRAVFVTRYKGAWGWYKRVEDAAVTLSLAYPQGGGLRGLKTLPSIESSEFFELCVCKIYSPSFAPMRIKS